MINKASFPNLMNYLFTKDVFCQFYKRSKKTKNIMFYSYKKLLTSKKKDLKNNNNEDREEVKLYI